MRLDIEALSSQVLTRLPALASVFVPLEILSNEAGCKAGIIDDECQWKLQKNLKCARADPNQAAPLGSLHSNLPKPCIVVEQSSVEMKDIQ
jgi:hypothetical protein